MEAGLGVWSATARDSGSAGTATGPADVDKRACVSLRGVDGAVSFGRVGNRGWVWEHRRRDGS